MSRVIIQVEQNSAIYTRIIAKLRPILNQPIGEIKASLEKNGVVFNHLVMGSDPADNTQKALEVLESLNSLGIATKVFRLPNHRSFEELKDPGFWEITTDALSFQIEEFRRNLENSEPDED